MKKYNLLKNAEKMGKIIVEFLGEMSIKYPDIVLNPRGMGVMDAIDFRTGKIRDEFFDRLYSKGVVVLKAGERTVRLRPPLILDEEDISEFSQRMKQVLGEMS